MQLKSLAKKTEALNSITSVLNTTYKTKKEYEEALAVVGKSYTTEILKAAIAESKLNEQQIKRILYANGLRGKILETTTAELANAASTNAVAASQAGTTATTIGLGTAFEGLWISIKKATKALWDFLFKTPAGWATLIIGAFAGAAFAVKTYNDSIEKAKEKAKERTSELFDEFKEMNKTLADHKKTVAELADRYDELSKGVNLSTNENRTLSTKEYEEFLDINEQLADTFPELTKGIDKNGRSILTLGTNGIAAKEQLEELLKAEEDLNNFRIAQDLEETFKGVYTYLKEADNATNTLNDSLDSVNETIDELRKKSENGIDLKNTEIVRFGYNYNGHYAENKNLIYSGDYGNKTDLAYKNALQKSAEDFFNRLSDERRSALNGRYSLNSKNLFETQYTYDGAFKVYSKLFALDDDEIKSLQGIIEDNISLLIGEFKDEVGSLSKELEKAVQEGESAWRDFIPSLVAGMTSYPAFKSLEDPDLQDIAVKIVEGLDSSYGTAMKEYNPDPYFYIRDKLLVPMSKLDETDKKKVKDAFAELMTLDANDISDKNIKQINDLTKEITDILGEDFDIKVALGFEIDDDVRNRYKSALKEAKRKLGGYGHDDRGFEVNNAIGDNLDDFWDENVKTEEDMLLWKQVTDGIVDATNAIEAYIEAKKM